jgi:abequosyltransferase
MLKNNYLISICIPTYNRPDELIRLLNSIDSLNHNLLQIVICENFSPKRNETTLAVKEFNENTAYNLKYIENIKNYGFDGNLKELIHNADGEFIMYMGDDDIFIPNMLDKYIEFLKLNRNCGYILRSYRNLNKNGSVENFTYYNKNRTFDSGINTYIELFDKSVFISGFCIKKDYTLPFLTKKLDGTLLFQLYLLAEVCLRYPSAYFYTPFTQAFVDSSPPMFGDSETEKKLYTPGSITIENSITFLKMYFKVIRYIDKENSIQSFEIIRKNMSKYSYPSLSIQWDKGRKQYKSYVVELRKIGMDKSFYFEIYNVGLLLFGRIFCDSVIRSLKILIGKRPNL